MVAFSNWWGNIQAILRGIKQTKYSADKNQAPPVRAQSGSCIYQSQNWKTLVMLLPPAYVVRGKVIFILGNVCLFTLWGWGGTPSQVWGVPHPKSGLGGYPIPGLVGGVPHLRSQGYPGYPPDQVWMGSPWTWDGVPPKTWDWVPPWTWDWVPIPPDLGPGTPLDLGPGTPWTWDWVLPPSIESTWYAAGGMPLAFTQEDFLVYTFITHVTWRGQLEMTNFQLLMLSPNLLKS